MIVPLWVSLLGIVEHVAVGAALVGLGLLWHTDVWVPFSWALALGIGHELGDGDLTRAPGHPWNGLVDVAAFLLVPAIALVVS